MYTVDRIVKMYSQEGHEDQAGHHEHAALVSAEVADRTESSEQNCCPEVGHAEQQMSGDHVAQESQRQRDGANNAPTGT